MKRRILSLMMAFATIMSVIAVPARAASTLDEAMAEVNVYADKTDLNWLTMNGSVKTQWYTYYNYTSPSGKTTEVPAYCVDPNLYGVPVKAPQGTPIKYGADHLETDPKLVGILSNGYPHYTLESLGVTSKEQAYYATKMALWCYLLGSWDISNLGVNPSLTGADRQTAENVLKAAKDIYQRGMYWDQMYQPRLTATPDQNSAYAVTINGTECYQQVFTIDSDTWALQPVRVSLEQGAPEGARILDMDGNEISQFALSQTRTPGAGYQAQIRVVYPKSAVEGQNGSVKLKFDTVVTEYKIYFAKTLQRDEYGDIQDYLLDTDPDTPLSVDAVSRYSDSPDTPDTPDTPDEPEGSTLKIVKLEEGTEKPLAGAIFDVWYPSGEKYGSFSTDESGTVTLPIHVFGNYTVTERIPPKYHLLPEIATQHVTVTAQTSGVLTFWNAPYGSLRVHKVSNVGNNLEGVGITIKNLETGETQSGRTNAAGVAEFTELKPGGYEVRETSGIKGYILDAEAVKTVTVVTGGTSEVTFVNKELPGLRIVKYDRATLQTMPDVTFEIWRDGESIGRYTTDQMGEILLTDQQPGTFVAREVQAPDSHVTDATPQQIELKAGDGIRQLVFFNSEKPKLRLIKVDSENLSKVIPNAKFSIQKVEGDAAAQEYTTDVNGEIDLSKLAPGSYVVTELDCPGYVIDDAQRIIELRGDETGEYVFTNSKRPTIHIIKLSSDGTPLPGVAFRIAKIEDGASYLDRTTDENGEIRIDNLDPGVYSVRETSTVSDHVLDLREFHVELFPGKTSTLVVENQRRPNLTVYKHDADTGEAIADTVFEVRAADGHSVDEIRTDESGKAELYDLLPGVYEITEKSVPADWLLDAPSQLVTLHANRNHTVYFENHRKPTLTVNKVSSVTGKPLEGAKFSVTYASNNTDTGEINDLGTFYTDENGQFTLTRLRDGWYKVEELASVPGYQPPDGNAVQTLYVGGGSNAVMTFENVPLSAITVYKYDTVTGEAVRDAVFEVRYLTDTSGTGGTAIGRYKTGANGSFTVTGLIRGTYIVEELASDNGHVIDSAPQTAFLSGEDQDVVQLYFGNTPKGSVLIVKKDALTGKPLAGVEFTVTDSSGALLGNANGKFTTDASGSVLIDGLNPGVTVVAKESRAISGYILDDTPQTAQVKAGATVTLEFRNQPKGGLIVEKYDSVTKEPLSGATFRITGANGELLPDNEGLTSSNGLYTTNAEGQIVLSKVASSTLVVTEVTAPDGYRLDPKPQTVVIGAGDTQTLRFYDDPLCTLTILKRDAVTKKPLAKAEFTVKYTDGAYAGSNNGRYVTGLDGTVTVTGLKPEATVLVTEDKAPLGYLKDDSPKTIVVHTGAANMLTFEDEAATTLVIRKFIEGTANEPLSGVAFKVIDGAGAAVGPDDGVYYTDKAGEIVLSGLEPGTTVKVREIKTVDGFILDGTPQDILIKAGEVQQLTFWNARQGALVIRKLSSEDKSPIPGAEFELRYADGRFVDQAGGKLSSNGRYTTDDKGEIRISDVTGTIVATEIKPAAGFTMNAATATQTVVVRSGDTQTLTFLNDPIGGLELLKVDAANRAKRLAGATFEIRRMDQGVVTTVTTDKNGRAFASLEDGGYYAVETEAPKGYKLDSTPTYFTVTDGKTTTVTVANKAFSGIEIHKIDAVTGEGVYGVTFLLYDSRNNVIGQYTSDDRGYVRIEEIDAGRYRVRELENPGYIVDTQLKTVEVKSGEVTLVEWKNTPITGQIQITKTSADYNSVNGWAAGTPIPNTIFEVYDRAGRLVDTIKTDKNGVAATKPLPLGRYKLIESKAADFYALDKTPIEVEIEFAGQIVKAAMTNQSLYTSVSITKRGYVEVMPSQTIRYDFSNIANNSTTALQSFYWRDTLPTNAVRLDKIVTGTWNVGGNYKIVYKTNYSGGEYRVLADSLATNRNYVLNASPAALGLGNGEYVTEFMAVFGVVPANFRQVEAPRVYCKVLDTLVGGTEFCNTADAGGVYNGQWIMAADRWVTRVYAPAKPLPRTGY